MFGEVDFFVVVFFVVDVVGSEVFVDGVFVGVEFEVDDLGVDVLFDCSGVIEGVVCLLVFGVDG